MLTRYDYIVVVFYFVFMTLMSWVFKRFVRNTSDYFRGGGEMLWWMAGAGAFMVSFSAVTFTGMAGKAYSDGPVVMVIFLGNALGFLFNYLWFAPVSRQTRAVTAMQVVRVRFGKINEQFFTWLQIPVGTLYAGLWLMGLCVFVSAGFGIPPIDLPLFGKLPALDATIIGTGAVVVFMALVGGSWSVMAGDFVQMIILMPVTIVAALFAMMKVGGVNEFVTRAPTKFWHWGEAGSWNIIGLWIAATLLQKFVSTNSMQDCSRYLSVKDSKHARKAALLGFVLFVVGPVLWFIPPMVARVLYPDMSAMFPNLKNTSEAAYFATAISTLPVGMTGLLLSGIFGATMSSMDGGLNKNAGFFVKNFYQVYVRPAASERELLFASKISTLVLGILIILAGLTAAHFEKLTIFEMMTYFSSLVGLPVAIPLVMGLFVKRAPAWAAWSTVLVGLISSLVTNWFLNAEAVQQMFGWSFNKRESSDWVFLAGTFMNIGVSCAWFWGSCLFARSRSNEEIQRVDKFFTLIHQPIDFQKEEGAGSDNLQARTMGMLCLIYGGFVLLLMLIPNSLMHRLAFGFCGLTMAGIGFWLRRASHAHATPERRIDDPQPVVPVMPAGEALAMQDSARGGK
ncbi:Na+:solute symporter [soil metagenome]